MPKINPPLSDAAIKALKPKDKIYKFCQSEFLITTNNEPWQLDNYL